MNARPIPQPDPATASYWRAAHEHRLAMPKCTACGQFHFYPRALCPHCGNDEFEWPTLSGDGSVFSFTIVQRAPSPGFEPQVPYVVAIVALDEGPHLMANIVGAEANAIQIGDRVKVDFLDLNDETGLPVFKTA
jgi:uncharacterized OB-fold protein